MTSPPATYVVISRTHSNRFSLNLRQNVSKGYDMIWQGADKESSWKNSRKTDGGVVASRPPFVRPRVKSPKPLLRIEYKLLKIPS